MMRRRILACLAFAAAAPLAAQGTKQGKAPAAAPAAPAPIAIPAVAVGSWEGKTMIGPKDSVIATTLTVIGADGKVSLTLQGRPTMAGRVIAAGGDSVTVEVGPYESILKKGLQATTRTTNHYKGNTATGTFEAKYSDGTTVKGKATGTKKAEAAKAPAKKP
jgi:hypothetical protein